MLRKKFYRLIFVLIRIDQLKNETNRYRCNGGHQFAIGSP